MEGDGAGVMDRLHRRRALLTSLAELAADGLRDLADGKLDVAEDIELAADLFAVGQAVVGLLEREDPEAQRDREARAVARMKRREERRKGRG